VEALGGTLHGYWYAFARVASTGAFTSVSTTKLLTVDEALDAFSRGGGLQYRAPGAAG
jgi:hypothetical protein